MKKWFILLLFSVFTVHAQVYKWTDKNGQVMYGNSPPPSVTVQNMSSPKTEPPQSEKSEVILYVTDNCDVCDAAKYLLYGYRVDYKTLAINTPQDLEAFRKLGGKQELPALSINGKILSGFEATTWIKTLKAAGYHKYQLKEKNPSLSNERK
jgi:glutaredoxin